MTPPACASHEDAPQRRRRRRRGSSGASGGASGGACLRALLAAALAAAALRGARATLSQETDGKCTFLVRAPPRPSEAAHMSQ
jgi:hypothetical protein